LQALEILLNGGRDREVVAEDEVDGGRRGLGIDGGMAGGRVGGEEAESLEGGLDGMGDLGLFLLIGA
jgi:hypothetical protein